MEQISFNFSEPVRGTQSPTIEKTVREGTHHIIGKNSFVFEEDVSIGGTKYQFKVSSRMKEGAYMFDENNHHITRLICTISLGKEEYRFDIGIADYQVIDSSIEARRYSDDSMGDRIGSIHFSAIKKIDARHGGPRFAKRHGENITSFDYFKYLFGGASPSDSLVPTIKKVILAIRAKHEMEEGK